MYRTSGECVYVYEFQSICTCSILLKLHYVLSCLVLRPRVSARDRLHGDLSTSQRSTNRCPSDRCTNPLISTRFHNNPLPDYYPYYQPSHSMTVHPRKKLPILSYMVRNPPPSLLVYDNNMMSNTIGMIYSRM